MLSNPVAQPTTAVGFTTVVVESCADDCHVCLAEHSTVWGRGRSEKEALGDLILKHPDIFKIALRSK